MEHFSGEAKAQSLTAFPGVAQIERGIRLVTRDVANILVTASGIGWQLTIKRSDATRRCVTQ